MKKNYIIINKDYVEAVDFKQVLETSPSTLRYSLDGSKTILKFMGDIPPFLDGEQVYSHSEIIEIINNPDNGWIDKNE